LTLSSFPTAVYTFHSLVDEQVATQRLGQHRFIIAYIAVCIKGLYTVYNGAGVRSTVTVLGLTTNQGRREPPQGPPEYWLQEKSGLGQRSIFIGGFR
jgi:hypothetical protein